MGDTAAPEVVFKRGRGGKRKARQREDGDDDEGQGAVIKAAKRPVTSGLRVADGGAGPSRAADDDLAAVYKGEGAIQQRGDMGATQVLEEDTDKTMDRRAQQEAFMRNEASGDDSQYRGMRGYKDWRGVRPCSAPPVFLADRGLPPPQRGMVQGVGEV